MQNSVFFLVLIAILTSCQPVESQTEPSQEFRDYWYDGTAELTRYELKQARYGEIHEGDAVLIFVTEEFRKDKQVKYEGGARKNVTPILKLNLTKKFYTGIYPYSIMSSIFTPLDASPTLKVTTSSQEWCGHTFTQFNRRGSNYMAKVFSYFQSEGDQEYALKSDLLEDHLWTQVRLSPDRLPVGDIQIIPGSQYLRLSHNTNKTVPARATLDEMSDPELSSAPLRKYRLEYTDLERTLEIVFEADFPHQIVAWTEEAVSGFGPKKQVLKTTAVKTHQRKSAYWGEHDVKHAPLRAELGLD